MSSKIDPYEGQIITLRRARYSWNGIAAALRAQGLKISDGSELRKWLRTARTKAAKAEKETSYYPRPPVTEALSKATALTSDSGLNPTPSSAVENPCGGVAQQRPGPAEASVLAEPKKKFTFTAADAAELNRYNSSHPLRIVVHEQPL